MHAVAEPRQNNLHDFLKAKNVPFERESVGCGEGNQCSNLADQKL
jgi:hypothetical protein